MSDTSSDTLFALTALSPLDGRYAAKTEALREWLSEYAFMKHRVKVEVHWLIALSQAGFDEIPPFSDASEDFLLQLAERLLDERRGVELRGIGVRARPHTQIAGAVREHARRRRCCVRT